MPKRTKKGGATNNAKVKEYSDKINNYIQYCERLKTLYDKKHEEVSTLTDYLIQIDRDFPEVPVTHQVVGDILDAISSLPEIDIKQQELTELDKIQDNLMRQAYDNRNNIYRKINELRKSKGNKPVAPPGLGGPPPPPGLGGTPLPPPPPGFGGTPPPPPGFGGTLPPPGELPGYLAPPGTGIPQPPRPIFPGNVFVPAELPKLVTPENLLDKTFFNMEKKDPFNLNDYREHLEKFSRNNFNFIPKENDITPDNPNLYINTYYYHFLTDNKEILSSLNRFINVNRYVITFQNAIVNLCQKHGRTQQEFNQVIKIPFENEAQEHNPSKPNEYYDLLINRTSELLGCLLKLNEMNLNQMYYYYKVLFDFLQLLISITPPGYIPKIQVSEEEEKLIKAMPKEVLEDILTQLLKGNLIKTEFLLKDRSLSSEVILKYYEFLLNNSKIERRMSANNVLQKKSKPKAKPKFGSV